jgi:hypothetical protein
MSLKVVNIKSTEYQPCGADLGQGRGKNDYFRRTDVKSAARMRRCTFRRG